MAKYEYGVTKYSLHSLPRWALLGGTPEVRSLAARYNKHLLCIDRNEEVLTALATMVKPRFSEELMCANWLDVTLSESVDLVFADGSLNMLSDDQHRSFVERLHRMLTPYGWAALRVHVAEGPVFSSPREVFEWRRAHRSQERIFSATRTHLDMLWAEPDTLRIRFADYHQRICTLHDKGVITNDEFTAYNKLLEFNKIELFYTTHEKFESMIADYFVVRDIYDGGDYTRSIQHPVYMLQKR